MFSNFPPLHPALVHFPIALLLLAGAFGILSLFVKKEFWKGLAVKSLIGGVIFFPFVVITGLIEEQNLDHSEAVHQILLIHKYLGITALFYYQALLLWYWLRRKLIGNKEYAGWVLSLVLGCLAISYQGYLGGEMVFKYGAGVEVTEPGKKGTGGHDHGMEKMDMSDSSKTNAEHKNDGHGHEDSSMNNMKGMDKMEGMDTMKNMKNMKGMPGMKMDNMKGMDKMKEMDMKNMKNMKDMKNMKGMPEMKMDNMKGMDTMKAMEGMDNMKGMEGMNNMNNMQGMKGMKLIDNSKPYDNNPAAEKAKPVKKNN